MPTPPLLYRDPLSFVPLFAALAVGVGAVTLVLAFAANSPMLATTLAGALTLGFVAIVAYEVNVLLCDEEPSA